MYKQGQTLKQFGSTYLVERVYHLTDAQIQQHGLIHRERVTLRKISGENGLDTYDFASVGDEQ